EHGRECGAVFFQAEDGIRDGHVTGVQTCALPISSYFAENGIDARVFSHSSFNTPPFPFGSIAIVSCSTGCRSGSTLMSSRATSRSEERRVGKECGSGWAPYHNQKRRCLVGIDMTA